MNPLPQRPTGPYHESVLYLGTAAILTIAFVALLMLGGALRLGWHDPAVVALARALPISVARGQGFSVSYRSWDELATAQQSYQTKIAGVRNVVTQGPRLIQQGALDSSVRLAETRRLAAQYGIRISGPEVQQQLQRFVEQTENASKFVQLLAEWYGWDVPTFQRVIVEPYLLRQKVDSAIAADRSLGEDSKAKADRVRAAAVEKDADFAALAIKESEDPVTAPDGGRTFITSTTFSDAAVSATVFALKEGEVSNVLATGRGYYVVKAEKLLKDETTGASVLQARVIFSALRNVDTIVAKNLAEHPPRILLYPFTWSPSLRCVISPGSSCAGS